MLTRTTPNTKQKQKGKIKMKKYNYYISSNDNAFGYDTTVFWNRKKNRFQSYLTKSCIYPTCNGAKRIFRKISENHVGISFYMKRI